MKAKIKYKANNVFRVAAESGVINYYKNGLVFYTGGAKTVYPLLFDASLVNTMSAVNQVMVYVTVLGSVISISPAKLNLAAGASTKFAALITGATADTITWSATGGSIDGAGSYTAPSTPGVYTVKSGLHFQSEHQRFGKRIGDLERRCDAAGHQQRQRIEHQHDRGHSFVEYRRAERHSSRVRHDRGLRQLINAEPFAGNESRSSIRRTYFGNDLPLSSPFERCRGQSGSLG